MYPERKTLNLAAILLIQSGKAVSKVGRTVAPGRSITVVVCEWQPQTKEPGIISLALSFAHIAALYG